MRVEVYVELFPDLEDCVREVFGKASTGPPEPTDAEPAPAVAPEAPVPPAMPSAASEQPEPFPSIKGWTFIRRLGQGGFGELYEARDSLNRKWAVKVPRRDRNLDMALFRKEAEVVVGLRHPHIVPVQDLGETTDGRCCIIYHLVDGEDLKARLARGRPSFAQTAR